MKIQDLSIQQFQQFTEAQSDNSLSESDKIIKLISIVYNKTVDEIELIPFDKLIKLFQEININFEIDNSVKKEVEIDGVNYKYVAEDIDNINTSTFIDTDSILPKDRIKFLHWIMAVLYMPINELPYDSNDIYSKWSRDARADIMLLKMPVSVAISALNDFTLKITELKKKFEGMFFFEEASPEVVDEVKEEKDAWGYYHWVYMLCQNNIDLQNEIYQSTVIRFLNMVSYQIFLNNKIKNSNNQSA